MNETNITVEHEGVALTVIATIIPAQNGGSSDPSWEMHLDDAAVLVGEVCINDLLTPETYDEIVRKATDKLVEQREEAMAERQMSARESAEVADYGW